VKAMANELAEYNIRVNAVLPTGVMAPMAAGLSNMTRLVEERRTSPRST
jgi:NAD(P)-dependent dehydrogenase (short-subunit alcohol dehydrogenase family)